VNFFFASIVVTFLLLSGLSYLTSGTLKPKFPISFGLISREGHMSLMLPGWHRGAVTRDSQPVGQSTEAGEIQRVARAFSIGDQEDVRLHRKNMKQNILLLLNFLLFLQYSVQYVSI